ncbi:N-methyl-L-tryptophan oxidase [Acinetobacter nectaris]|uniref:N-methyl-L-tryptophan oxidase n=1 Tax=Acinetobacter nectaris TaxID=1219382 RepID=UPI001F019290|nr:N-methyl-L-tryptophan oxidase [Acinetobacter nectaris]MCF9046679.1 N-methyl-L-tryptophan oxidase [Acinetobacter nectaris]
MKVYDVAVVGTGSIGSAAGYYARAMGASVVQIDSEHPPHCKGSHHGETRLMRHAYAEGEKYIPLVLKAQCLWNDLELKTNKPIFHRVGVLNIAPKNTDFYKNVLMTAQQYNIPIKQYTALEIQKRWPNWTFDASYIGLFEPDAGYLNAPLAIETYLSESRKIGASQLFGFEVIKIQYCETRDFIIIQSADGKEVYAKQVIVCVGTWIGNIFPELPVQPKRKVFEWFNISDQKLSEEKGFPAFAIQLKNSATYYGFPAKNGQIKIGRHDGGQNISTLNENSEYGTYTNDAIEIEGLLKNHLSGVEHLSHGAACSYDMSPDEDFIIDWLNSKKNIQIVTGLSGHGFKFVSVLGWLMAQRALGKAIDYDLSAFRLNRFNDKTE